MATKPMDLARNAMQTTPIKEAKRRNRNKVKDPEKPEVEVEAEAGAEAEAGRKTAGETAESNRTATGTRPRPRARTVAPRKSSHVPSTSSIRSATIPVGVSGRNARAMSPNTLVDPMCWETSS